MRKKLKMIASFLFWGGPFLQASDICYPDNGAVCSEQWPETNPSFCITPHAGPCVSRGRDLYITLEFLYWSAHEDNLGFAYTSEVAHPNWHFEPGFKIGLGLLKDHDGWDVYANYTWLRVKNTKNSRSTKDPQHYLILPIENSSVVKDLIDIRKISGEWELDFNVVNLELGRNFFYQ